MRRITHAHAREQLADAEGLGQVIVCACVQRSDLVLLVLADREDNDRDLGPLAQLPGDRNPVRVRQADVENDQIGPILDHSGNRSAAVLRFEHQVIMSGERDAQEFSN